VVDSWRRKLGDKVVRPRRVKRLHLRRVLGVPALFSIGYGDVGSSIYYGLGVVALVALGATPIALAFAGLIYVFNALSYAEGSAMLPEGGGSASYSRLGFNDMVGFISGWVLMLSYIATIAISAYTIPPYLAYFWPVLKTPFAGTLTSMGIIVFLMIINIIGIKESAGLNIFFIVVDIFTQVTLIILGAVLILIPNPSILIEHMFGPGNFPTASALVLGIALAALCFTGVESVAQQGEETRHPEKSMPRAYIIMIAAVLILFAGISVVALSAMTPQTLGDPVNGWARDPVAGIANGISMVIDPVTLAGKISAGPEVQIVLKWVFEGIREFLPILVAVLAATILLVATNAGLLGISRLTYNLSSHKQLPATLSRVQSRFRTPYIAIILFCGVAIIMLAPGFYSDTFFSDLGSVYVFGSLLTFAMAHAAILALRAKRPDMKRPFRLLGSLNIKGAKLPITAILGLVGTAVIWVIVIIIQPYSRIAGFAWMAIGLVIYVAFRLKAKLPLLHLPEEPKTELPKHELHKPK
jgi:basic amino acid/polyamine antiporter, APA family